MNSGKKFPKVSVITVNYNQAEVTCDMLASLEKCGYPNLEIIVVDNASPKDCSVIPLKFPHVKFIKNRVNSGFAGGNNVGIKEADGDFILLLNNDTIVEKGFLEPLVETFSKNKNAGIVSPKLIFFYTENLIQYAGTGKISNITARGKTYGYMEKDSGEYDFEKETELAHGACMMISREILDKVGLLDETFFMYYEEYDYCERVKKAGFKIYYNGHSKVLHKQSVSTGKNSPLKSYYLMRNRLRFSLMHIDGMKKIFPVLFTLCIACPKEVIKEFLGGRKENSKAVLRGVRNALFPSF